MKNPFARSDSAGGSFLPQDYVARKAELRANLLCLGLFGVVMFGVIAAFFVTNRQWLQVRHEQQTITVQYSQEAAKIEQLDKLEVQKAEMMGKAEITTALIEKVPRATLLSELIGRMPQEITLLELQLVSKRIKDSAPSKGPTATVSAGPSVQSLTAKASNASGKPAAAAKTKAPSEPEKVPPPKFDYTLHLIGVAKENNNIADYLAALKACPVLDNVDLKYIKDCTIEKMDLRKFEIEATIAKNADARGLEPVKDLSASGAPGASLKRTQTQDSDQGQPQTQTSVTGKEQ